MSSRTLLVASLLALLLGPVPAGHAELASALDYRWPVDGHAVASFDAPASPWAAGHRGVDLPVVAGQPVRAMAPGRVTFAGNVAGTTWATVSHPDGIRTSYGPLQPGTAVATGTPVGPRTVLGRARGDAHGHAGRLHVGARRGDRYLDPAQLVRAGPLVATLVDAGEVAARAGEGVARPVLVPGTPPSPNHLVVLPGLTSRSGHVPFDVTGLGYGDGTWQQFSYLGVDADGQPVPYGPDATWARVHDMALRLRDQLRAHAADHPAQAVDLVGHSLGGLVAMYYLLVVHDATDPTLPPIGRVATVASPLQGADSAEAIATLRASRIGRALLDLVAAQLVDPHTGRPVVHADVAVLEDLRVGSAATDAVAAAWQRYLDDPYASPLATGTEVLTVGSMLDPVVNEHRAGLPGGDHHTVLDPNPVTAHESATTDERSEALLGAFLGREALPHRRLRDHLVDATRGVGSRLLAGLEEALAAGVWAVDAAMVPGP